MTNTFKFNLKGFNEAKGYKDDTHKVIKMGLSIAVLIGIATLSGISSAIVIQKCLSNDRNGR